MAALLLSAIAPALQAAGSVQEDELVKRGEYLAHLGDCVACHTAKGGKPLAGGLEMQTPFGTIHSTNITPDALTGIGSYSFGAFDRAMRQGVAADGHNLYPVMPYTSFARISPDDMHALYAYLMKGVQPVQQANQKNHMQWPFSMRFGLKFWNAVFLKETPFKPDPSKSAQWNRGAYIVQGLGHCGACHSPRGIAMQEKAQSDEGEAGLSYLTGSTLEHWRAVNLRNRWSGESFAQFLKTGHNRYATAYGTMTDVVHHSSQHFSDSDLAAIGEYLSSLSPNDETNSIMPHQVVKASEKDLYKTRGGLGYVQFCSTCHQYDGRGVEKFFPPLANNSSVQAKDPTSVIHVILSGWKSPVTESARHGFYMPSYSRLGDQELAEIITFVRAQWGNRGLPVTAVDVKKVREEIEARGEEASKAALPRFADFLARPNADQLVYGMRLMMDSKELMPEHVGDVLQCTSCHLNGGTVAHAAPYPGVAAVFPTYRPRSGKIIDIKDRLNGCLRRSMNGKPLDKESRELSAMVAFMDSMKVDVKAGQPIPGRGVGKMDHKIVPDLANGKKVYDNQCAVCHGKNGEGLQRQDGSYVFPPLWGKQSFNIGAGMARTYKAAAFVKHNMPISASSTFPLGQGGLTDQEAVDVAQYFTHMPRPDFAAKKKDWPKGGKPVDARY
ncbi:MAG: c-type cytochrome [Betaproteobacteria bacterium]|nr:c-type cytochrome [Betaproteobacteria bacterium]MDE2623059.1 c-type cytochrome [Betaproteobacteria bacterium]